MEKYVQAQAGYLAEIEETFAPLPVLRVPHLGEEVFGLDLLRRIGDGLYGAPGRRARATPPPSSTREPTYTVEPDGDAYTVGIRVPYTTHDDVEVEAFGDASSSTSPTSGAT